MSRNGDAGADSLVAAPQALLATASIRNRLRNVLATVSTKLFREIMMSSISRDTLLVAVQIPTFCRVSVAVQRCSAGIMGALMHTTDRQLDPVHSQIANAVDCSVRRYRTCYYKSDRPVWVRVYRVIDDPADRSINAGAGHRSDDHAD